MTLALFALAVLLLLGSLVALVALVLRHYHRPRRQERMPDAAIRERLTSPPEPEPERARLVKDGGASASPASARSVASLSAMARFSRRSPRS